MMNLNEIKAPVDHHLQEFEKQFRNSMKSKVPLLDKITRYIVKRKGKQMRPLFVFFSAGLCGEISERTYRAASLIELLHTATLIHDDVVDDSNERRGFFSLNALWKNKISVLVGDYLLSRGLLLALDNDDFDLLKIVSRSVKQMSEGELLQLEKARNLDIKQDVYFEIIQKKTASLIASCFECGAASAGADKETQEKLRLMGEYTGIAFQIKDDLLDYSNGKDTGKPSGGDIRERKMTLPLIHLLDHSTFLEKRKIINIVKNHNQDPDKIAVLIDKVNQSGGIDYARQKMEENLQKAFDILNTLPDSPWRKSLRDLVQFTIDRQN
ncbi:MAG: polyprenyl synthetase family protein [Bacteroidetes bacterium]|nr:MAG: polyprenyl synthetase family protein [Bacteroidota bacterium]